MFSLVELQQSTRNHGMTLEALRYPITPVGLDDLLIHTTSPQSIAAAWRLQVGGAVRRPLELSLEDLRRLPRRTRVVTMECAGNGRVLQGDPRPTSQPWLLEAVGTGQWAGPELRTVLAWPTWTRPRSRWCSPSRTRGRGRRRARPASAACRSPRRWKPARSSQTS